MGELGYGRRFTTCGQSNMVFVCMFGCRGPVISAGAADVGSGVTVVVESIRGVGFGLFPSYFPVSCMVGQLRTLRERSIGVMGIIADPPAALCVPGSSGPGTSGVVFMM